MIDTHAHLTDVAYAENQDDIINNLKNNGIQKVFTVAYNKDSIVDAFELSQKHENVYAILGVHPEDCLDATNDVLDSIRTLAKNPKVIAIGEIGLDYHYKGFDKQAQKQAFIKQLELAHELQLPIVIHNRDSIGDMLQILNNNKHLLEYGGVFHCFSESLEVYNEIKKLGLKISFNGILTFKNAITAPRVCENADLEDILIETDCPYLTPHPYRGEVNEPKYVSLVAKKICELRNMSYEDVINATTQNALNLFKKANNNE